MIQLIQQIARDWRFYARTEGRSMLSPLGFSGYWVLAVHRYGGWASGVSIPVIGHFLRALSRIAKFVVVVITGARISVSAKIGQRFIIHTTQGLQIASTVRIGDDCTVNSGVCIVWAANGRAAGAPTIGNDVYFGVDAKVIGNIKIGDHVQVGANAVVGRDIPDNMFVMSPTPIVMPRPAPPVGHTRASSTQTRAVGE